VAIKQPSSESINEAVNLLRSGDLVGLPTETVYGLAADATSDLAVQKIYTAKGRPSTNPLIIHIHSKESAELFANLSDPLVKNRFDRISTLWPGPISIIVPSAGQAISSIARAGQDTIALRVPNHPVALQILKEVNLPLAAPSANQSFYVSPTQAIHVERSLGSKVPLIIDGGTCQIGLESTVIDITKKTPIILRPGAITQETLKTILGEPVEQRKITKSEIDAGIISPGLLAKHYSPRTPLKRIEIFSANTETQNVGVIRFSPETQISGIKPKVLVTISENKDLNEIATKLYGAIRELDDLNLDLILIDSCSQDGVGGAIMDRIERATQN
jgi:L-threonylcarbamoyladenylate synthase